MRNSIKSIEHRSINGRGMEDLNKFKQKMHEEIKDISAESQNVINEMDINELVGKINKNGAPRYFVWVGGNSSLPPRR